ncbi:hypothetical protein CRE_09620 [Caenorhabditis remanei]|uniref:Uncharacterized protein n=1 Tax=Caenorhabditis remanei TaxID=31234 RepID=E3MJ03_CAERE|nr:hypothetical protein CRE_09620 [Caenorhabditis remanei]
MNWFIILSLFCIWNFQECHCCKWSADHCECSDIVDILRRPFDDDKDGILISDKVGCVRNITCRDSTYTYVIISFDESVIDRPDDSLNDIAYVDSADLITGVRTGPVDVFSLFGMSCENEKWYVTKYPFGLSYNTVNSTKYITGGLDGKRSEIGKVICNPVNPPCECSDIVDLFDDHSDKSKIPVTDKDGCDKSITCDADEYFTYITISFNGSEIVRPDDSHKDNEAYVDSINHQTGEPRGPLDIFSFYGMSCENKKWYVTKYPFGLHYYAEDHVEFKHITGDLDGKKSEITKIACKPPGI